MLGLLVIIVVSWVLLHFIEKKNIDALGIIPNGKRSIQFLIGLIIMMLINLLNIYIESIILSVDWELNSSINYKNIFNSFVYHIRSALTEDLVFRGAILYILIQRIGSQKAIMLSAISFGVYHVFSYGMTGDRIVPIIYVILVTSFIGYVWAYTFYKTKSILMGLGFHLGFNLVMTFFYESQPYGELLFTQLSRGDISGWNEVYFSLFKGLFPSIATLIFIKLWLRFNVKDIQKTN